jgi:hypothetical protein
MEIGKQTGRFEGRYSRASGTSPHFGAKFLSEAIFFLPNAGGLWLCIWGSESGPGDPLKSLIRSCTDLIF